MNFAKLYTWVVGFLFLVAVGYTLTVELVTRGITLEAGHKALHVLIGLWAVVIVVRKLEPQYRIFALVNGLLWGAVQGVAQFPRALVPRCGQGRPVRLAALGGPLGNTIREAVRAQVSRSGGKLRA